MWTLSGFLDHLELFRYIKNWFKYHIKYSIYIHVRLFLVLKFYPYIILFARVTCVEFQGLQYETGPMLSRN